MLRILAELAQVCKRALANVGTDTFASVLAWWRANQVMTVGSSPTGFTLAFVGLHTPSVLTTRFLAFGNGAMHTLPSLVTLAHARTNTSAMTTIEADWLITMDSCPSIFAETPVVCTAKTFSVHTRLASRFLTRVAKEAHRALAYIKANALTSVHALGHTRYSARRSWNAT